MPVVGCSFNSISSFSILVIAALLPDFLSSAISSIAFDSSFIIYGILKALYEVFYIFCRF